MNCFTIKCRCRWHSGLVRRAGNARRDLNSETARACRGRRRRAAPAAKLRHTDVWSIHNWRCVMHASRSRTAVVLSFVAIVGAPLAVGSGSPAYAQQRVATTYQYSAKTLCTLLGDVGFGEAFAPGRYRTVINIHNPTERKIEITRKFALSLQPGEAAGSFSITPYKSLTLEADQAVAYNCFDIASFYCPIHGICVHFTAIDGFLVV